MLANYETDFSINRSNDMTTMINKYSKLKEITQLIREEIVLVSHVK